MNKKAMMVAACAVALTATGCGKPQEAAGEKVAERMIESAFQKDGTKANVQLSEGSAKITTTDAAGKTSEMEIGAAKVTEADVGVPFYPGSKPVEGGAMRVKTPEGTAVTISLQSNDPPAKVAEFYRGKLKAQSSGKLFNDMSSADGASLSLIDESNKSSVQVNVGKSDQGSDINIAVHRGPAK